MEYRILAIRTAVSLLGNAKAWLKQDGEIMVFDSFEEAKGLAKRLNNGKVSQNVHYQAMEFNRF